MAALILVVDDDAAMRAVISEALRLDGYLMVEAHHDAAVLQVLEQIIPSGMILDLGMSVMDVPTLVRAVRALPLPCLVDTADLHAAQRNGELGVDALLTNPFDVEVVLATVWNTCGPPAAVVVRLLQTEMSCADHRVTGRLCHGEACACLPIPQTPPPRRGGTDMRTPPR